MATDTKTPNLVINTLSQEQFDEIENPSDTELYLTPDTTAEEIANAVSAHNTSTTAHNDIRQAVSLKANSADLADVATSGSYSDLLNKPSINGTTLNGNLDITTYYPYPEDFIIDTTFEDLIDSILNSVGAKQGMAYLGTISGDYMPWGYGGAECKVEYMQDDIAVLTINSADVAPYTWSYNTYSGDYTWKSNILQTKTMPDTGYTEDVIVQYIGETTTDYTNGYFYKCVDGEWVELEVQKTTPVAWGNITGTLSNQEDLQTELDKKQNTLTAGDNITIAEDTETGNLVISASSGKEYTPGIGIDISEDNEISIENFGRVANRLYGTSHLADPAMISAGDNITIDRFTISAKDTTYLAGENITITSGREVAPGYTRVKYVEASGVAFIDTGTKMTANSVLTFVGKGSHTYTGGASGSMLGVCSSNYRNTIAIRTSGTNEVGWTIGSAGYSNRSDLEMETVVVNLPESKAYFNGTAFNITSITPEDYNTYLFATNAGGNYYKLGDGRFQSFKQEDNGVKTCEFVACVRQSDDRAGVYETVSGRFLTCSGLTAGPAAGDDEYYINAVGGGTTYTAGTGIDITNNEISAVKGEWEWKGQATSSITFGTNTETTNLYQGTVLIGYSNNIGYNTTDTVTYNVILGYNNSTYGAEDGIMIGRYNLANGQKIVCIGKDNAIGGTNVIAIGNDINSGTADVQSSIMIGDSVEALANNTIAIGISSGTTVTQATKSGSMAIGRVAQATNLNAIAIGHNVTSSSGNSVAIGGYTNALGMSSLAIGAGASNVQTSATATGSIAIGSGAEATNSYAISLGRESQATQEKSVALGYSASATGTDTIAIGNNANATVSETIAIGSYAKATALNSIQLGAGTNNTSGSLQFKSYQLVDSSGYIPAGRLASFSQTGYEGRVLTINDRGEPEWAELDVPKPTYDAATKTISF